MYRLTYPEMRVLYGGYQVDERLKEDQRNGVEPGDRKKLKEFDAQLQKRRD